MVRVRKIALLGFPAVGKSSLASRFVSKTFSEDYCTTIESLTITKLTLPNGQEFLVHLYDTMGVTEQPTVPDDYMLMDAWVIVFDVTNRRSFNVVMDLYQKLRDSGAQRFAPLPDAIQTSSLGWEIVYPKYFRELFSRSFFSLIH